LSLPYDMLHRHAHTQSEEALVLIKMIPTYWETDISYIRQDTNRNSQIGIEENQQWEIIVPFFYLNATYFEGPISLLIVLLTILNLSCRLVIIRTVLNQHSPVAFPN
jgi:hypothetical protein